MAEIRLEHVSFTYPGGYTAVEDACLTIPQGQALAILGQNGAGKTTTVKMMNNLTVPTKGNVYVGDKKHPGLYDGPDCPSGGLCVSESR